jgi:hypothetical protein
MQYEYNILRAVLSQHSSYNRVNTVDSVMQIPSSKGHAQENYNISLRHVDFLERYLVNNF